MTQAALIILDDARPTALVLGLSWPEFQMRRAVRAGALHIVLVADRVTRDVVEAVDRLRGDGVSTTLARTSAEVADLFHPDEAVLLMTGGAIVDDGTMSALLAAPEATLLCIDAEHAGPSHELIDAKSHWAGIARITGAQIRATVPLAGDWDLGSTLMRQAVAARAKRTMLGTDALVIDATTAAGVAQASRTLVVPEDIVRGGWGAHWAVTPLALLAMRSLPAVLPAVARFGSLVAVLLFFLAPVAQVRMWTTAAFALYLVALLIVAATRIATVATGIPLRAERWVAPIRDLAGVVLLLMIGAAGWPDDTPIVLCIGIIAFAGLIDRLGQVVVAAEASWFADRAGHAAILSVASIFGSDGLLLGLSACAAHGLISLALLQRRLSRVLTLTN